MNENLLPLIFALSFLLCLFVGCKFLDFFRAPLNNKQGIFYIIVGGPFVWIGTPIVLIIIALYKAFTWIEEKLK